jgi:hypothetical protein
MVNRTPIHGVQLIQMPLGEIAARLADLEANVAALEARLSATK